MKKLFLIDVSSLFFRAFYAVRPLTTPSGLPTNAIYGFLSMVMKLLKEEKPEYLVFCYDRKEPSFRAEIYPEYKAHRSEMPEDLVPQIPYIKKLAEVMGIPSLEVPTFEADDLIGTLTHWGLRNNMEVMIVSGDKDFGQLVTDHVYLVDTMKDTKLGTQGVKDKWGVKPEQFIDFLALVGDTSDNIPGVMGVGPKGAIKLLEQFGSLKGIYENLDQIKGSLKDKLEKCKDDAFLSQKLVTIIDNVPLPVETGAFRRRAFDRPALTAFLAEVNFKTLEKNIWSLDHIGSDSLQAEPSTLVAAAVPESKKAEKAHGLLPIREVEISDLRKELKPKSEIWGFLSDRGTFLAKADEVLSLRGEPRELGPISDELDLCWKGFDLKTFWHLIKPQNPRTSWDSQLASYVVKPGDNMSFDQVYFRKVGEAIPDLPDGAELFECHRKLESALRKRLAEVHGEGIFEKLDLPLTSVLYKMERRGISLDKDLLAKQSVELARDISALEKEIQATAGEDFNVASPKQLAHVMFEKLKMPPSKKTKTGFSTDNDVLEKLRKDYPLAKLVLEYRELAKLRSTYVDSLPLLVKEDGRIHSHFNQALTTTGRLSSNEPNLQNIPIRTPRGALVRRAFVAGPGKVLLSVDYSQIELRILAHYSEDPNLTKAFMEDLDIHTATAAEVFGVPLSQVTTEQRRAAKAVNFGIAYGQGAFGLAENLGISRTESSEIIKRYFTKFSRVQNYIEDTITSAKAKGFVETLEGRRRYMPELKSQNVMVQKSGERAAINAPIQGTAADIVKRAMIELDQKVNVPMILQVHDELIFEDVPAQVEAKRSQIVSLMENVVHLKVPLKANSAVGKNWDSAK